jgi:predicted small lipoprotein YifL
VTRAILALLLAALVAVSIGACGRRGDPEVPVGQVDTLKANKYPPDNGY